MPKIKELRVFIIVLLIYLSLGKFTPIHAIEIFSDLFSGGYNNSWQVTPNSLSPIPSAHGIAAASSSQWSDILLPLNQNIAYNAQFDLWINTNNVSSAWRLYIINSSFSNYKIINNWGPNNLLQVSEFNGVDTLTAWNHSTGLHHFEIIFSPLADTDIIVIEDGIEIARIASTAGFDIAYINIGLLGLGDYEISNFVLSTDTISTTPTPTPTTLPTPTPSPTSTPTPTPTPTPPASKKVIVIPGFGASWNADALFNCKADGYQGPWVLHPLEKNIYPSLYAALTSAGHTPVPFYYDWRKQLGSQTASLFSLIASNTSSDEYVDLVGHSFGGLIGRAYISDKQTNSKIDKYLSAGTPHKGTPFAYPAWSGGELWKTDFNYWVYMTTMIRLCQIRYNLDSQDAIQRFVPSTKDILAIFPYLRNDRTHQLKSISNMQTKNTWLPSHPFPPSWGTVIGTLSGSGKETLSSIVVKDASRNEIREGKWADGKPTKKEYSNQGDGTILVQSSQLPGADNRVIQTDHAGIVGSIAGQQEIISFLNGTQNLQLFGLRSAPLLITKKTSALLVLSYPANASLIDPDGNVTTDTEGLIAIDEPKKGKYTVSVSPKKLGHTKVIVGQFYDNGKYFWKEYSHWLPLKKIFKFYIDPKKPSANIDYDYHD